MDPKDLPRWTSHKIVRAAKIVAIDFNERLDLAPHGVVEVGEAWIVNRRAHAGGYFVVYDDGYTSFSPAEPFETGYTLVDGERVIDPAHRYRLSGAQVLQFMKKEKRGDEFALVADGTTNEELLAVLLDRLVTLNSVVPSVENTRAIHNLEKGLVWLEARTRDRQKRDVEGTPNI